MTLNGVMALILLYFTSFVYDVVVKQLPRFQNLLLIAYNHVNTLCAIIRVAEDMDIQWISDFGNIHGYLWILMDIFTARRYASAVLAVVVCPSVCHTPVLCQNDGT